MSPAVVLSGPPRECSRDGHLIALRLQREVADTAIRIVPFCELCHHVFLPASGMNGWPADFLMRLVEGAQFAPEAPPEAYEHIYDEPGAA